nr:chemotaxis protein CheW [Planctomycetota bacterium]
MAEALTSTVLLCRCGTRYVVVEARELAEVMRPLPVRPLVDCPPPGVGETTVRGEAAMVLDLAALFVLAAHDPALAAAPAPTPRPAASATSARFLALPGGGPRVVLAVDEIVAVRCAFPEALAGLVRLADHPLPLARVLDEGVRRALQAVRLVGDADWG